MAAAWTSSLLDMYWLFLLLYFSRGFFVYSPPPVHVYIRALRPQMNTSVIHNMVYKVSFFRVRFIFLTLEDSLHFFLPAADFFSLVTVRLRPMYVDPLEARLRCFCSSSGALSVATTRIDEVLPTVDRLNSIRRQVLPLSTVGSFLCSSSGLPCCCRGIQPNWIALLQREPPGFNCCCSCHCGTRRNWIGAPLLSSLCNTPCYSFH
jgi:hypothetical protein